MQPFLFPWVWSIQPQQQVVMHLSLVPPPQRLPMCWPQLCFSRRLPPQPGPRLPSEPHCASEVGFSPFPSPVSHLPCFHLITAETRLCRNRACQKRAIFSASNVRRHLRLLPSALLSPHKKLVPGDNVRSSAHIKHFSSTSSPRLIHLTVCKYQWLSWRGPLCKQTAEALEEVVRYWPPFLLNLIAVWRG